MLTQIAQQAKQALTEQGIIGHEAQGKFVGDWAGN